MLSFNLLFYAFLMMEGSLEGIQVRDSMDSFCPQLDLPSVPAA
jgi:hypothetical protein